jgi:hypothetical protein
MRSAGTSNWSPLGGANSRMKDFYDVWLTFAPTDLAPQYSAGEDESAVRRTNICSSLKHLQCSRCSI